MNFIFLIKVITQMENTANIWFFAKFDLFRYLSREEKKILDQSMEMRKVRKGQSVHFPDMHENYVYILKKGIISVNESMKSGSGQIKYMITEGNIFGEYIQVDTSEKKLDQAIALKDCWVCFLDKKIFKQFAEENPEFVFTIHKIIGFRVRKIERKLNTLAFKNCKERIQELIVDMASRYGSENDHSVIFKNIFTHHDIAKLTASTTEIVDITLKVWQEQDIVFRDRKQNEILISW